jgi:SP family general alpha glucoside:H+ symporter-like MFS transporter
MIGAMLVIFLLLPESPWWLAGKNKLEKAEKILLRYNGHIEGYNVHDNIVGLLPYKSFNVQCMLRIAIL